MDESTFVLDADVFIQAYRNYYAFDIVPSFWSFLIHHANDKKICSVDKVKEELPRGKDALSRWIEENFEDAFCTCDEEIIIDTYKNIMKWVVSNQQFKDAAKPGKLYVSLDFQ